MLKKYSGGKNGMLATLVTPKQDGKWRFPEFARFSLVHLVNSGGRSHSLVITIPGI